MWKNRAMGFNHAELLCANADLPTPQFSHPVKMDIVIPVLFPMGEGDQGQRDRTYESPLKQVVVIYKDISRYGYSQGK